MPKLTIELTNDEMKALAYAAVDPVEWVTNFTKVRCAAAMQEIYESEIAQLRADPKVKSIPISVEEVFRAARFESAAERQAKFLATPPIVPPPDEAKS